MLITKNHEMYTCRNIVLYNVYITKNQWIAWYDDVDNKMLMYLADMDIIVACASGYGL